MRCAVEPNNAWNRSFLLGIAFGLLCLFAYTEGWFSKIKESVPVPEVLQPENPLKIGDCYYDGDDEDYGRPEGAKPDFLHCAIYIGEDGFTRCQTHLKANGEYHPEWYACDNTVKWRFYKGTKIECPIRSCNVSNRTEEESTL